MPRDYAREAINNQKRIGIISTQPETSFDAAIMARVEALEKTALALNQNIVALAFADFVTYTDQTATLFDSITREAATVKIAESVFAMRR